MFSKILIANRGEIAVRIIRACREMGIQTVAVFSKADRESLHVKLADDAICIGEAPSSESYLNIPSLISAAEIADVEAIHPGYGFLAENAHFAEICESCQIKFIGPKPESIRMAGDKSNARIEMKKANIPIIPGSKGAVTDQEEALRLAKKLGYPVIVKASAGGGGKGIKIAHNDGKLISAYLTAQTEAAAAFGNGEVYIEKYIEEPRHIEVQIIADSFGNVVHLGERDCSVQRRHQKLIEESPAPGMSAKLRKKIGDTAIRAAKAFKYENAGTIEFLLDKNEDFYFMEMNTRLQVEHPVTEMVTGLDLVKEQLRVAAGEKLSFTQEQVTITGHAIECRINAEDPDNNFMPSPGKIDVWRMPGGPNVRLDSHVYAGYSIPPFYDSMIAKLIVTASSRETAIARMKRALSEFDIRGIKTTIPCQQAIVSHPDFLAGKYDIGWVSRFLENREKEEKEK